MAGSTVGIWLMVRETVAIETRAWAATVRISMRAGFLVRGLRFFCAISCKLLLLYLAASVRVLEGMDIRLLYIRPNGLIRHLRPIDTRERCPAAAAICCSAGST